MKLTSAIFALVALAVVPFVTQAEPRGDAVVDACVKAFVDTYLPAHPVKQVNKQAPAPGPIDTYYAPRHYLIALSAHGVRSGNLLAQARCVANRRGVVIVLDNPPADEYVSRADFVVSLR